MGILYIISIILLISSFLIYKKSEEKLNFIKWLILSFGIMYMYNITLCMLLGLVHITTNTWLLAIINVIFSCMLLYKPIKNKEIQKYTVTKLNVVGLLLIIVIFSVMFVKDLYIYKGDISHFAIDSGIHYRAAKHYADNLKLFINVEDKTFFNFNVMQTGAYINDGLFMNTIHSFINIDYSYLYQIFETMTLFIGGLAFYAFCIDRIKTKRGLVGSLVLFALYIYGYPYNSWIYGFSYLSVGILALSILLTIVEELYSKNNIQRRILYPLVGMSGMGLIFSYCLFVPAVFPAICIYCFIQDLKNKDTKKILKFFGTKTIFITVMLLIVTVIGICYLFIPTFFIDDQTNLVEALKADGGVYSEKIANFVPYIPFAILYISYLINKIKNKDIGYFDLYAICMFAYVALLFVGNHFGKVAPYYMLKGYFALWIAVFAVLVELVNEYVDKKVFRIDSMVAFIIFVIMLVKRIDSTTIFKFYMFLLLALYTVLPEILEKIDLSKYKKLPDWLKNFKFKDIKISPYVYATCWGLFVCLWVLLKAGTVLGEEQKHALPNLVGIYYSENCEYRKLIDLTMNFNANEIDVVKYARENLKDITVENTELITEGYYTRVWAVAMLEYRSSEVSYKKVVQDTNTYTLDTALENEDTKYIIKLVSHDQAALDAYKEVFEDAKENESINILYENENGFVAEINR